MSKRYFRSSVLLLVPLLLLLTGAAHPRTREQDKREPIVITSNRMEANKLGSKVTFTGDVTLKKEGMTLYSDSMIVYYDERTKGIRQIDASGNVVVRKEGRVALSNKASYYSRE